MCFCRIPLHPVINLLFTWASLKGFQLPETKSTLAKTFSSHSGRLFWTKHLPALVSQRRQSLFSLGSAQLVEAVLVVDEKQEGGRHRNLCKQWVALKRRSKFCPALNKKVGHRNCLWNVGCLFISALGRSLVVSITFGVRTKGVPMTRPHSFILRGRLTAIDPHVYTHTHTHTHTHCSPQCAGRYSEEESPAGSEASFLTLFKYFKLLPLPFA